MNDTKVFLWQFMVLPEDFSISRNFMILRDNILESGDSVIKPSLGF